MNFVERLRHELALEAQRAEQKAVQEKADLEDKEKARLQAKIAERERRAPRRQQAEGFREQSGVGAVVAELGAFLATPTIPITVRVSITDGGDAYEERLTGRGTSNLGLGGISLVPKDPDSVFDCAWWDKIKCGSSDVKRGGWYEHFSEKYIAVETRPDGVIIFHGGWRGSTTIQAAEWRSNNKEMIFDKALEKAFKNPGTHRYSVWHAPDYSHKG